MPDLLETPPTDSPATGDSQRATLSFHACLDARRVVLRAMPERAITRRLALDLVTVSTMASRAVSAVTPHREALVARFGPEVSTLLESLEITSRAARQAEVERVNEENGTSDLAALHAEVVSTYQRLVIDAKSLVLRGFLRKERLVSRHDLKSYEGALQSLLRLVGLFRDSWDALEPHTPVVVEDLDHAERVCDRMGSALAGRHSRAAREARETRTRALSLLVREYEELRRMISFVRWFDGDADRIVPSLYVGRGGRGKKKNTEPRDDTDAPVTP